MACTAWVKGADDTWGFQTYAAGDDKCGSAVCSRDTATLVSCVAGSRESRASGHHEIGARQGFFDARLVVNLLCRLLSGCHD